jgi:hypothetical protein
LKKAAQTLFETGPVALKPARLSVKEFFASFFQKRSLLSYCPLP